MQILIDNKSGAPIYEQIYTQLKEQIISGALTEDQPLPSIRLREEQLKKIEDHLSEVRRLAATISLSREDIRDMLDLMWEDES